MVIILVRNVTVDTLHPIGRVRSSHRSDHKGHTSGLNIGARIGIRYGFGTHAEVFRRDLVSVTTLFPKVFSYERAPAARSLSQTIPAFIVSPTSSQEVVIIGILRKLG